MLRPVIPFALLVTLFALPGRAQAPAGSAAARRDPCQGRVGVVDGVDADGVLCDYAAAQAASQRFTALTTAAEAAQITPGACDDANVAAIKAKVDGAMEWSKAARKVRAAIAIQDAQLAQLRASMAAERANPSGVVDLTQLHDLGADIQTVTAQRAQLVAEQKADEAHMKKLNEQTTAALKAPACVARLKANKAAAAAAASAPTAPSAAPAPTAASSAAPPGH